MKKGGECTRLKAKKMIRETRWVLIKFSSDSFSKGAKKNRPTSIRTQAIIPVPPANGSLSRVGRVFTLVARKGLNNSQYQNPLQNPSKCKRRRLNLPASADTLTRSQWCALSVSYNPARTLCSLSQGSEDIC